MWSPCCLIIPREFICVCVCVCLWVCLCLSYQKKRIILFSEVIPLAYFPFCKQNEQASDVRAMYLCPLGSISLVFSLLWTLYYCWSLSLTSVRLCPPIGNKKVSWVLQAGMGQSEETAVAKKRFCNRVSMVTNSHDNSNRYISNSRVTVVSDISCTDGVDVL
jgi:hypothetical protein